MILTLPYPPSTNRYYRKFGNRIVISKEGRSFRWWVLASRPVDGWPVPGPVKLLIVVYPPTRWGIDLDNACKATCDALEDVKVIRNDREIAELTVLRGPPQEVPFMRVLVETIPPW